MVASLDDKGNLLVDGQVTPDGYAVNALLSVNRPLPAGAPEAELLPNQTFPTIGDRLNDAGVDWAWYAEGWDDAIAGQPRSDFTRIIISRSSTLPTTPKERKGSAGI